MQAETVVRVTADLPGERLDILIARVCDLTRARAQKLIDDGNVMLAPPEGAVEAAPTRKRQPRPGDKLLVGATFTVTLPAPVPAEPAAEAIDLDILYEDEHLIVINKPAGMPVHPGPGHNSRTMVNALLAHCPQLPGIGGVQRPGIVHRLDKDTSGVIVAAKDDRTHIGLSSQLKDRKVKKTYLALVEGVVKPPEAIIDAPIGRDPNNRRRMMVIGNGRDAQTAYIVREQFARQALLEASPVTGRTHQIRVHLASAGHAIAGDVVYGRASPLLTRQFLHAWRLTFRHPVTGAELTFEAPLPPDLQAAVDAARSA